MRNYFTELRRKLISANKFSWIYTLIQHKIPVPEVPDAREI